MTYKELHDQLRTAADEMHRAQNDYARGVGLRSEMERAQAAFHAAAAACERSRAQACGGWTRMDSFL